MAIPQVSAQQQLRATAAVAALRKNSVPASTTTAGSRHADDVRISDAARSLAAAHNAVANAVDVREDRISALKAAIADGSYSIDSRALARGMAKALTR
jgi:negative regulator of flagellin synthesis FlgM